jgi:hypothetical protein
MYHLTINYYTEPRMISTIEFMKQSNKSQRTIIWINRCESTLIPFEMRMKYIHWYIERSMDNFTVEYISIRRFDLVFHYVRVYFPMHSTVVIRN